jgi:alpha-acetolactate decarboxylase
VRTPLPLVFLVLIAPACRSVGWEGEVQQYGTVREALHQGHSQARVRVADAAHAESCVGLGALAGLAGEVTILDGATWVTRAGPNGVLQTAQTAGDEQATLLVTAQVHEWIEMQIESELSLAELPAQAGFAAGEWASLPFVVRGRLVALDAHVLNGACPESGSPPAGSEPVRRHEAQTFGILVGFWVREGTGVITHAGQSLHVHVIVPGERAYTAHVDRVRIAAGSTLYVPRTHELKQRSSIMSRAYGP